MQSAPDGEIVEECMDGHRTPKVTEVGRVQALDGLVNTIEGLKIAVSRRELFFRSGWRGGVRGHEL